VLWRGFVVAAMVGGGGLAGAEVCQLNWVVSQLKEVD
jgi:hypothetical protein